jgi:hypothetical protein
MGMSMEMCRRLVIKKIKAFMKSKNKMKRKLILLLLFCGISLLNACKSSKNTATVASIQAVDSLQKDEVLIKGILERQGITTYQYGTHVLLDTAGKTLYALKSESLQLDLYIGKKVELKGKLVEDYPVDGGPSYLEVIRIKE